MSLNVAIFNALAPEFSNLDAAGQARRDILSGIAATEISQSVFCDKYDAALAFLTAHYMKKNSATGSSSGFKTGERVGDIALSYQPMDKSGSDLSTTGYGEQFLRLRKQLVKSPYYVGGCDGQSHR